MRMLEGALPVHLARHYHRFRKRKSEYTTRPFSKKIMTDIDGVILAGGRSRRMGRDKSTLQVGGISMLERVARAMRPVVERIRVSGIELDDNGGYETQPDIYPGLGPLAGIHAGLSTTDAPAVLVVACDLPFVTTELLTGLIDALSPAHDAVVPRVAGRAVPVCAVYSRSCVERLETALKRGELAATRFADEIVTHFVEGEALARLDPSGVGLRNINTPDELKDAESIAAKLT
jgi:molybdopterin-guanine dinucleotide biosynthesis protein A